MDKNLKNEIASAARDILQPVFMGILRNQDDTLLSRGGTKGLAIYDDIERDALAHAVINKRKMAVVSFPWEVDPASNSLKDRKAAELVKAQLTAINFDKLTLDLLDAILKGFSIGEVVWNSDGNQIYVERIIPRNQRRFVFDEFRQVRMLTMQNMLKGEELPQRKFIVHSTGGKDGSPYGLGLGSKLFWPTYFKRQNITFWLTFADKFGSPTAIGKYPGGTSDTEQSDLLTAISSIAQESGVIVPDNMVIELLEASRSGAGDFYERMCRYMDEQISVAVLGETMTTIAKAAGLGSGQSDVQNDIRLELARADADLLTGTLQETLVRWMVELNMPGAGIPRVWRKIEAQEDLNARAERDERIKALGFKPTLDYITETYGEGWVLDAPVTPAQPTSPSQNPANNAADANAAFAEGDEFADQTALDEAIELLASDNMQAQMEKLLAPIAKLVNTSTPEQLQNRFAESYAELDTEAMQELMARAFFVAEVWGKLHGD
jgi:phage gp29-like protein